MFACIGFILLVLSVVLFSALGFNHEKYRITTITGTTYEHCEFRYCDKGTSYYVTPDGTMLALREFTSARERNE
jgi:hypothetical protein